MTDLLDRSLSLSLPLKPNKTSLKKKYFKKILKYVFLERIFKKLKIFKYILI